MTPERRHKLKRLFERGILKRVICTTVWKRAVDFKALSVLIRADASSSAIDSTQIPGRTARVNPGKSTSIIIDYRDQFNSTTRANANKRKRHYARHGWNQVFPRKPKPEPAQTYWDF